eukprot:3791102-Prymnesium_polylepis.1
MSEVSGYQPVSRIGEVVMNAFGALASHSNPPPKQTLQHIAALIPKQLALFFRHFGSERLWPCGHWNGIQIIETRHSSSL